MPSPYSSIDAALQKQDCVLSFNELDRGRRKKASYEISRLVKSHERIGEIWQIYTEQL